MEENHFHAQQSTFQHLEKLLASCIGAIKDFATDDASQATPPPNQLQKGLWLSFHGLLRFFPNLTNLSEVIKLFNWINFQRKIGMITMSG